MFADLSKFKHKYFFLLPRQLTLDIGITSSRKISSSESFFKPHLLLLQDILTVQSADLYLEVIECKFCCLLQINLLYLQRLWEVVSFHLCD